MYWNSCWTSTFNPRVFPKKVFFTEYLFSFFFSDSPFRLSFQRLERRYYKNSRFFKRFFWSRARLLYWKRHGLYKKKKIPIYKNRLRYNFSKIWVVKYNSFLLLSFFCFFYFRVKRKRKGKRELKFVKSSEIAIFLKRRKRKEKKNFTKCKFGPEYVKSLCF